MISPVLHKKNLSGLPAKGDAVVGRGGFYGSPPDSLIHLAIPASKMLPFAGFP